MSAERGVAEGVQFVEFSARGLKTKNGADNVWLFGATIAGLCVIGLAGVLRQMGVFGGLFPAVVETGTAAYWLVFCVIIIRHSRRRKRAEADAGEGEDSAGRIACVGESEMLAAHGELTDVAFAPSVFFAPVLPSAANRARSVVVWVGLSVGLLIPTFIASYAMTGRPYGLGIAQLVGPVALAFLVAEFLYPQYVRIVPGRVDVLHYAPLRWRAVRTERYNLKRARVFVDLKLSVVVIDDRERKLEFSTAFIPRGRRLAYMILLAAISTHEPGPLPDDELLG